MSEVEAALRLDPRIGRKSVCSSRVGVGVARWLAMCSFSRRLAKKTGSGVPLLAAVLESNDLHKGWVVRHLRQQLGGLSGKENWDSGHRVQSRN